VLVWAGVNPRRTSSRRSLTLSQYLTAKGAKAAKLLLKYQNWPGALGVLGGAAFRRTLVEPRHAPAQRLHMIQHARRPFLIVLLAAALIVLIPDLEVALVLVG